MIKLRAMGTTGDLKRLNRLIDRLEDIEVISRSDILSSVGTNRYYQELYRKKQSLYADYKEERHKLKELQDAEKIVKEVLREDAGQEKREKEQEKQAR